ncbi:MAG: hypothetical protein MUC63_01505 [Planctomycetes bacterium]|nr:hypothetical protein [Planctomycetota bacterium]
MGPDADTKPSGRSGDDWRRPRATHSLMVLAVLAAALAWAGSQRHSVLAEDPGIPPQAGELDEDPGSLSPAPDPGQGSRGVRRRPGRSSQAARIDLSLEGALPGKPVEARVLEGRAPAPDVLAGRAPAGADEFTGTAARRRRALEDEEIAEEARRNPPYETTMARELQRSFSLHRDKEHALAIETGKRIYYGMTKPNPEKAVFAYNIGCGYALSGDRDRALDWLEIAVEDGWANLEYMKSDTDLESLREEDRFRRIVGSSAPENLAPAEPEPVEAEIWLTVGIETAFPMLDMFKGPPVFSGVGISFDRLEKSYGLDLKISISAVSAGRLSFDDYQFQHLTGHYFNLRFGLPVRTTGALGFFARPGISIEGITLRGYTRYVTDKPRRVEASFSTTSVTLGVCTDLGANLRLGPGCSIGGAVNLSKFFAVNGTVDGMKDLGTSSPKPFRDHYKGSVSISFSFNLAIIF